MAALTQLYILISLSVPFLLSSSFCLQLIMNFPFIRCLWLLFFSFLSTPSSFLPFSKPPEKWGGFVPPALARDEWNLGPEEAGAGWPPHSWPFEGRQAAHHSKIGLGQRVSRIRAVRRFTISTCGFQTCLHCSFSRTNNSLFKLLLPLMILILGDLGLLCSFPAYLIVSLFIL